MEANYPQSSAGKHSHQSARNRVTYQQVPYASETKSPDQGRGFLMKLVPEIGIEPTTYALRMRRSTN